MDKLSLENQKIKKPMVKLSLENQKCKTPMVKLSFEPVRTQGAFSRRDPLWRLLMALFIATEGRKLLSGL